MGYGGLFPSLKVKTNTSRAFYRKRWEMTHVTHLTHYVRKRMVVRRIAMDDKVQQLKGTEAEPILRNRPAKSKELNAPPVS